MADFGNVAMGMQTSVTFTVTNNSETAIDSLTITPSAGYTIAADSGCQNGAALAAATPCTVKLTVSVGINQATPLQGTVTFQAGTVTTTLVTLKTLATPVASASLELFGITGNSAGSPIEFGEVAQNSTSANGSGVVTIWFVNNGGLPAKDVTGTLTNSIHDRSVRVLAGRRKQGYLLHPDGQRARSGRDLQRASAVQAAERHRRLSEDRAASR